MQSQRHAGAASTAIGCGDDRGAWPGKSLARWKSNVRGHSATSRVNAGRQILRSLLPSPFVAQFPPQELEFRRTIPASEGQRIVEDHIAQGPVSSIPGMTSVQASFARRFARTILSATSPANVPRAERTSTVRESSGAEASHIENLERSKAMRPYRSILIGKSSRWRSAPTHPSSVQGTLALLLLISEVRLALDKVARHVGSRLLIAQITMEALRSTASSRYFSRLWHREGGKRGRWPPRLPGVIRTPYGVPKSLIRLTQDRAGDLHAESCRRWD